MLERLRERRPQWGYFGAGLGCMPIFVCCLGAAIGVVTPPSEVDEAPGHEAFERELAVATSLGFNVREQDTLDIDDGEHVVDVPLAAGECAAFMASAWGFSEVSRLRLGEGEAWLAEHVPEGMVGHVQYCATAPTTLRAHADIHARDSWLSRSAYSGGTLRYAVLAGPFPAGLSGLNRGALTEEGARRLPTDVIFARADALAAGLVPWGPPLAVPAFRARLVPESTESYDQLRWLARNRSRQAMRPRVALLPVDAPQPWRPSSTVPRGDATGDENVPAVAFEGSTMLRVLAVVDAAALGRCVTVQLIQPLWRAQTQARRLEVTGDAAGTASGDGNVMHERLCGGRATYVTADTDHSEYLLRLYVDVQ